MPHFEGISSAGASYRSHALLEREEKRNAIQTFVCLFFPENSFRKLFIYLSSPKLPYPLILQKKKKTSKDEMQTFQQQIWFFLLLFAFFHLCSCYFNITMSTKSHLPLLFVFHETTGLLYLREKIHRRV